MIVPLVHHIAFPTMRDFINKDALPPGILWRSGPMGHVDLLQATAVRRWVEAFPVVQDEWSHELVGCRGTRLHTPVSGEAAGSGAAFRRAHSFVTLRLLRST